MSSKFELIKRVLGKIKYNDSIPDDSSLDEPLCKELSQLYASKLVTGDLVKRIISNIAFEKQLALREYPEYKTVTFKGNALQSIIKEINDELESIPKRYEFIFLLPKSEETVEPFKIRDNIEILTLGDETSKYKIESEPKASAKGLAGVLQSIQSLGTASNQILLKDNDTILRITSTGYVHKYGNVLVKTEDPLFLYKVIIGFYINRNVLGSTNPINYYDKLPLSYSVIDKSNNHVIKNFEGDSADTSLRNRREFNQSNDMVTANKALAILFDRNSATPNIQSRLKNSLYWYYEATKTSQTFLRITSVVSALDALVSSSQSTKESKADHIAEIVAKRVILEQDTRENILKLYNLRNSIVHGETSISSLDDFTKDGNENSLISFYGLYCLSVYLSKRLQKYCD